MARQKDYYKIIGVNEKASQADIKKAYKKLAIKYHPDKNLKNKDAAEAKFKEISEAYYVLGNKEKRSQYDMMRQYGFSGASSQSSQGFNGAQGFNFDDLLNQFSRSSARGSSRSNSDYSMFSDVFGDLFNMGSSGQSSPFGFSDNVRKQKTCGSSCNSTANNRGYQKMTSDLNMNITLSKKQALSGAKIKLKLENNKTLMVTIPANSKNGNKLKINNQGKICPCCEKRGDLLLILNVK